jgi:hypothetical protein
MCIRSFLSLLVVDDVRDFLVTVHQCYGLPNLRVSIIEEERPCGAQRCHVEGMDTSSRIAVHVFCSFASCVRLHCQFHE